MVNPVAGDAIAPRCAVVIRTGKKPCVVERNSKMEEASGVMELLLMPMPCERIFPEQKKIHIPMLHNVFFFIEKKFNLSVKEQLTVSRGWQNNTLKVTKNRLIVRRRKNIFQQIACDGNHVICSEILLYYYYFFACAGLSVGLQLINVSSCSNVGSGNKQVVKCSIHHKAFNFSPL